MTELSLDNYDAAFQARTGAFDANIRTIEEALQRRQQQPPQWTLADVEAASPELLRQALGAGQLLEHLGTPPPRTGRRHDNDPAPTSPLVQLVAQQQTQATASQKASTAPSTLTDADIAALDEQTVTALVEAGRLAHLGIGPSKRRSR